MLHEVLVPPPDEPSLQLSVRARRESLWSPALWGSPPWVHHGQAYAPDAHPGEWCPTHRRARARLSAVLFRAQDVAPKGGYAPIRTARNIPKGGASTLVMVTASAFIYTWGMYKIIQANRTRR